MTQLEFTFHQTLIIVGCGKSKRTTASKAKDLYTGGLFRLARQYAESTGSRWLICSAKHGLLDPEATVDPYDATLVGAGADARRAFGFRCQADLCGEFNDHGKPDSVVILAGKDYVSPLLTTRLSSILVELPLQGLQIGQRQQWLKRAANGRAVAV